MASSVCLGQVGRVGVHVTGPYLRFIILTAGTAQAFQALYNGYFYATCQHLRWVLFPHSQMKKPNDKDLPRATRCSW